jgi:hypothetical protein
MKAVRLQVLATVCACGLVISPCGFAQQTANSSSPPQKTTTSSSSTGAQPQPPSTPAPNAQSAAPPQPGQQAQPPAEPSLEDLGIAPAQAQPNLKLQHELDRRSHMLQIHQRLGLVTGALMLATVLAASGAKQRHGTPSGRELHTILGSTTTGFYAATAWYAIRAPKIAGTKTRGPIRVHKFLAWIHGPGMILTPVLGAMAYSQIQRGERVHGIAKLHGAVATVTYLSYAAALLSVTVKF